MKKFLAVLVALLTSLVNVPLPAFAQTGASIPLPTRSGGKFYAASYGKWAVHTTSSTPAAAATINVDSGAPLTNSGYGGGVSDSRTLNAFQNSFPRGGGFISVSVDSGSSNEVVTLTGSSGCTSQANLGTGQLSTCSLTASSFANAHGQGATVTSGTAGLQEAINDAAASGGGVVLVDAGWTLLGGTTAMLVAASVASNVVIEDDRASSVQYWNPSQGGAGTIFAAPTVLSAQAACDSTHTFCSDATVAGTWTSGTLYGCVAYVDIMGQEGPCSTTANFTTVVSKAVDVGAPAASTGAVGYVIYLSLIGGSYAASYAVPITSAVCTLTQLETTTPACAVTNTTYQQVGSSAQVIAPTVNTSPGMLLATTASATTAYVGTPNGRSVAYVYAPSSRVGIPGVPGYSLPFSITTAAATTVPNVVATINLPPGYMNQVGRTIRVCAFASSTGTSTATVTQFTLWWEASLSNAAGPVPLVLGGPRVTGTLSSAIDNYSFCQDLTTTVAGVTGTVLPGVGSLTFSDTVNGTHPFSGPNTQVGASASAPNLVNSGGFPTHLHVVYLHTTGTDGAGMIVQKVTVEAL